MKRTLLEVDENAFIFGVPDDCLLHVFQFLNFSDLINVLLVCKHFSQFKVSFDNLILEGKINPKFKNILLDFYHKNFENIQSQIPWQTLIRKYLQFLALGKMNPNFEYLILGIGLNDSKWLEKYDFYSNPTNDNGAKIRKTFGIDELYLLEDITKKIQCYLPIIEMLKFSDQTIKDYLITIVEKDIQRGKNKDIRNNYLFWWSIFLNQNLAICTKLFDLTCSKGGQFKNPDVLFRFIMHYSYNKNDETFVDLVIIYNRLDILQWLKSKECLILNRKAVQLHTGKKLLNIPGFMRSFYYACINGFVDVVKFLSNTQLLIMFKSEDNSDFFYHCFLKTLSTKKWAVCESLIEMQLIDIQQINFEDYYLSLIDKTQIVDGKIVIIDELKSWLSKYNIQLDFSYIFLQMIKKRYEEFDYSDSFLLEAATYLVAQGANVNFTSSPTDSPALCFAVDSNNLPLTEFLLVNGADTSIISFSELSRHADLLIHPLWIAIANSNIVMVKLLIDHGFDFNFHGWNPLFVAALKGPEIFNLCAQHTNIQIARLQMTALIKDLQKNDLDCGILVKNFIESDLFGIDSEDDYKDEKLDQIYLLENLTNCLKLNTLPIQISNLQFNCCALIFFELQLYFYKQQGKTVEASLLEAFIVRIHSDINLNLQEHFENWKTKVYETFSNHPFFACKDVSRVVPIIEKIVAHSKNYYQPTPLMKEDNHNQLNF